MMTRDSGLLFGPRCTLTIEPILFVKRLQNEIVEDVAYT